MRGFVPCAFGSGNESWLLSVPTHWTTVQSTWHSCRSLIWRNGLPDLNPTGVLLLALCVNHSLSIVKTMFEHKGVYKCMWHQQVDDQLFNRIFRSAAICSGYLGEERHWAVNWFPPVTYLSWIRYWGRMLVSRGVPKHIVRSSTPLTALVRQHFEVDWGHWVRMNHFQRLHCWSSCTDVGARWSVPVTVVTP